MVFALFALITFTLALFAHTFYYLKRKQTRIFQGLMVLGIAMEITAYGIRTASSTNPFMLNW